MSAESQRWHNLSALCILCHLPVSIGKLVFPHLNLHKVTNKLNGINVKNVQKQHMKYYTLQN